MMYIITTYGVVYPTIIYLLMLLKNHTHTIILINSCTYTSNDIYHSLFCVLLHNFFNCNAMQSHIFYALNISSL